MESARMNPHRELSEIESAILENVIDLYIRTGSPVSSRNLKSRYRIGCSTANIRKILHSLEEKGYLYKPHVSAGRIPSDRGYRHYVDEMKRIRPLGRKIAEEVRKNIGQDMEDVGDVMYRTSRVLGEVTNCMGLIMGVLHSYGEIGQLSIRRLEGVSALVVLKMSTGSERKVFIEFPKRYKAYIVDRAVQIINERIAGFPIEEAHHRLESFMREYGGIEREIAQTLAANVEHLFETPYSLEYHFHGLADPGKIPELNDPKILKNLVRLMGERSLMLSMMKRRMKEDMMITIGKENLLDELEDFSVITRRFSSYGYDGVFGVLGPTRMSYDLVISLLEMMGNEMQVR